VHIRPLKVPDEDLLELRPTPNAVGRQEFEPCLNVLPDTDGEVLDDEVVIIRLEIFQLYSGVRLPGVLGDVGGRPEARREWRFLDAASEGPWARAIRIGALVAVVVTQSAATPWGALPCCPLGWWALAVSVVAQSILPPRWAVAVSG
jgi:hypothetical protein